MMLYKYYNVYLMFLVSEEIRQRREPLLDIFFALAIIILSGIKTNYAFNVYKRIVYTKFRKNMYWRNFLCKSLHVQCISLLLR